jgi:hypothetical protein
VTRTLEQGVSFVDSTGGAGSDTTVTYKSDGTTSSGASNIYVQGNVLQGTAHRYTISITSVGKVSSALARVAVP